jgi:glycerol transport system ATP-binding protein
VAEVVLKGLSFRYPQSTQATLMELSLTVHRGEAHALLGGSGAGKTTLLNLLSGLLTAPPGSIYFDGRDVSGLAPWDRRVSQVFQFPVLYESLTVAGNLAFPARGMARAARAARVREVAERLGLAALLERRPAELSLVSRQLVAIAKALVRPDLSLVLLDEPLTAAEPEAKWRLRQALRAAQAELGATMIYVTHDQAEALTLADRVSVLEGGRILQTATPRELVEEPLHEHVGYFVGSPGMNLVDAEVSNGACRVGPTRVADIRLADGACRLGFRPEWARVVVAPPTRPAAQGTDGIAESGARPIRVPVTIRSLRTLTTERQRPVGLVTALLNGVEIRTRQRLDEVAVGPALLELDPGRLLCFRDGWRIADAH